jgi:hypothetical protein
MAFVNYSLGEGSHMVSLFPMVVIVVLLTGLLLCFLLPADFRKTFFNPESIVEQLIVKSLGFVGLIALVAELVVGSGPNNGLNGTSPCCLFGAYIVLIVYGRAAWYFWSRQSPQQTLPADAAGR